MANKYTRLSDEQREHLPVLSDEEIAQLEAENTILQFDRVDALMRDALTSGTFHLSPSIVCELNALALAGLDPSPGAYRREGIEILGSRHRPPPWQDVGSLLEQCCDYVNERWSASTAVHLAAYAMWRIAWIHPFMNGNGRTSRAIGHLVLGVRLGMRLPGQPGVNSLIARDRRPYYKALHKADSAYLRKHIVDVSYMERLIEEYLEIQLESAFAPPER